MFAVDQPFTDECCERNLPNNSLFWESYEDPLYQEELLLNPMSPNNIAIFDEPNNLPYGSRYERPSFPLPMPQSFAVSPSPHTVHPPIYRRPFPQYEPPRRAEGFVRNPSPRYHSGFHSVHAPVPTSMPIRTIAPPPLLPVHTTTTTTIAPPPSLPVPTTFAPPPSLPVQTAAAAAAATTTTTTTTTTAATTTTTAPPTSQPQPQTMPLPSNNKKQRKQKRDTSRNHKKEVDTSMYQVDLYKVLTGKDMRMTLMIRNIPNGYLLLSVLLS